MNTLSIGENIDLQPFNTLALPARARYFAAIDTTDHLTEALNWAQTKKLPLLVIGGGSNIILRGTWPGLVLQIALQGKKMQRGNEHASVTVAAGENWHALVQWSLHEQLFGLENLTLIPGTAGAAPIQNIGAYGVELSQFLHAVRGYSLDEKSIIELSAEDCRLGYRDSIFKHALRDRFVITEVVLALRTQFAPVVSYPALREKLQGGAVTAQRIEQAVRAIRQSKLPNPAQLPNAGSFFKNPVVTAAHYAELAARHIGLPQFQAPNGIKVPAAWLLDRAGWKGQRRGHVGVHAEQALVLINYGGGDADELLELAQAIQADVQHRFGVTLELEPNVYGN
ncbi:MAG: UDP-N-acetylenolpyruvoylglucosamine reductase [Verrucomicrobiaceae bacterium]|nr:UDP-N-acetylenolpyruvoylglucosamine reductase [Verrucomicrobiaceae bacterium]